MGATVGSDCTLFASPDGSDANSGTSPGSSLTLSEAVSRTEPGSIVCLLPGIYPVDTSLGLTHSGTSSAWIVYKSYDPANRATLIPRSGDFALLQIPINVRYVEIRDLKFDGKNTADNGIACNGGDHLRIIHNEFRYLGMSGVGTYPDATTGQGCDYLYIDHNIIYHSGYNQGWSSAISFNQERWYDQYTGFHSYVLNNIISGEFDGSTYHTDGNGIIMDNPNGGDTPPVLIANNVVYENGGRCITALHGTNYWVVNNTCYQNGLDLNVNQSDGEIIVNGASNNYVVNNIAYSWNNRYPYFDSGSNNKYYHNLWYTRGTGTNHVPASVSSDPAQLKKGDPLYVNPPYVDPSAGGQYANALDAASLTNQLQVQAGSPALNAGMDPSTIAGIPSAIQSDLKRYIYTDINGQPRPQGGAFDLGAYEYVSPPP